MLGICVTARPVTVTVGPLTVTVPPSYADVWLTAITSADPVSAIIPGLLEPQETPAVAMGLLNGSVSSKDLQDGALAAMAEAGGRSWWEVMRLVGWADQADGELYGHMVLAGVDPSRVTLAAWCSGFYTMLMRNRDDKERTKLLFDLTVPPPGVEEDTDNWDTVVW